MGKFVNDGKAFNVLRADLANIAASQTDSSIVAAVAGKKIRVLAVLLHNAGTASAVTFNSKLGAAAGVAISPALLASGPPTGFLEHGWWETVAGAALTVTTGAGSTTGIQVIYTLA
jgi:hypothetical protein